MQGDGRYKIINSIIIALQDILILNLVYFISISFFGHSDEDVYTLLGLFLNLSYLTSLAFVTIEYDIIQMQIKDILQRSLYRLIFILVITLFCLFLSKRSGDVSRLFISILFPTLYIIVITCHFITKKILLNLFKNNNIAVNAVILGCGSIGKMLCDEITGNKYLGINILGFFDDYKKGENIIGTIDDLKDYSRDNNVQRIFCTLPLSAKEKIMDVFEYSEKNVISFHIVPTILHYMNNPVFLESIGKTPVFSIRKVPLGYVHNTILKRTFDIVFSFLFLITLFPICYIILGLGIKLSSPGPIFFIQERTGKKGKSFNCYKFRSMKLNDDAHTKQATANDDRKTKIGSFMRKTNLDELPQFINVLKGNMSIVGPRPHMDAHTVHYSPIVEKYMIRHLIKPGITGWAQINGFRGETRELSEMEGRIKKDIWYIENWSFLLDIEIILKTAFVSLKGDKKAY